MRRAVAIGGAGVLAAAGAGAAIVAQGDGDGSARASARTPAGATAEVERRDLVEREDLDGTLRYAGEGTLIAGTSGTITRLREPGAVVRRGRALYAVDGRSAAWLLYGALPAWRDFAPGMAGGEDVRQLERNLRALGHDPDGDLPSTTSGTGRRPRPWSASRTSAGSTRTARSPAASSSSARVRPASAS